MGRNGGILREEVDALRLEDVRAHLVLSGWKHDATASWDTGSIFRRGSEEVLLPARRDLRDYALRMADVVDVLASTEAKSPRVVLSELMQAPSADVIRLRDVSPVSTQGSVPIDEGLRLIRGGREGLLAAAHSAKDPLDYHPRMGVKDAVDFLNQCRLGQTERGSFVATILVPVPPAIDSHQQTMFGDSDAEAEPYPRRVTRLFMSALGAIRGSLDSGQPAQLLSAHDRGISSNFCDAVADMLPRSDQAQVEVSMSWSRTRSVTSGSVPARITLGAGEAITISEVGRKLRERQSRLPQTVVGVIVGVSGNTSSLFEGFQGTVRVHSEQYDHQLTFKLSWEEFQRALDAYRSGKSVQVTGLIRRSGKIVEILQPTAFHAVEGA